MSEQDDIPYDGTNDFVDAQKDYFTDSDSNFLMVKKNASGTNEGKIIHDNKNENFGKIINTTPIGEQPNRPPVAKAGLDVTVLPGATTILDGTLSTDPDGNLTEYSWKSITDNTIVLTPVTENNSKVSAKMPETEKDYEFELTVKDSFGLDAVDTVVVTVKKQTEPPVSEKININSIVVDGPTDPGKTPEMCIDDNWETRCSFNGKGRKLTANFKQYKQVTRLLIRQYWYDREYYIDVNSNRFTIPKNLPPETFHVIDLTPLNIQNVDKLEIIGQGNEQSDYNSYRRLELWGIPAEPGNNPPVITGPSVVNALPGSEVNFGVNISDLDADIDTIEWHEISGTIDFEISEDKDSVKFTAPNEEKEIGFTVTVKDKKGNMTTHTILVIVRNVVVSDSFRVLLFADNDTTTGAKQVLNAIKQEIEDTVNKIKVKLIGFIGDGPYSTRGVTWVNMMKEYLQQYVDMFMISQGNHDHKESESNQTQIDIEAWLPHLKNKPQTTAMTLQDAQTIPWIKELVDASPDTSRWSEPTWLDGRHVGNMYVISMNSQDADIEFKRNQFIYVRKQLEVARKLFNEGKIKWILTLIHKPWFTEKSSHSPYTAVRNVYHKLFEEFKVHIMGHGHNHNTQLWVPMVVIPTSSGNGEGKALFEKTPDGAYDFTKPHGTCYIITGHGGHEHNPINEQNPNVMYHNDTKYGYTELVVEDSLVTVNSKDTNRNILFSYKISQIQAGPERADAKFNELLIDVPVGKDAILDGSRSKGVKTWTITKKQGPEVTLVDVPNLKYSKKFVMPDTDEVFLFELTVTDEQGNSDKDTMSVRKSTGGGGGGNEEVLWDSNVHLKVEQETKVTNTFGSQEINGKGIWMAASGSPRCIIRPNGEFDLEAGAGHGRIYIQCQNYNARLEGEVKIDDSFSVVRNTTWRLRCRHNEPQPCENKFGGFGATHEMEEQLAEYSTESCHNNHENTIKKPLAKKVQRSQWINFKFSVADNLEKTQVLFKTEYDYGDGNGFVTVLSGKHSSPKDYYLRESDFLVKRSYAWLRMNNESTGKVTYRNVKIVKIPAGSLGSGTGFMIGSDTEIDTGITPSKEDLERANKK